MSANGDGTPLFDCWVRRDERHARVFIAGEIDLAARSELDAALADLVDGSLGEVRVDLTAVTFMDTTGLHWLVRTREAVAESGAMLEISVVDGSVRDVLALTGVDRLLPLAPGSPME